MLLSLNFVTISSLIACIAVQGVSAIAKDCPNNWVPLISSCYYFSKFKTTWSNARSSCRGLGGHLAVPKNSNENNAIWRSAQQRGHKAPWIGLLRHRNQKFYTVHGLKPRYTPWNPGEPNGAGVENCTHYYFNVKKWNDATCSNKYNFICERQKLVRQKVYCGEHNMKLMIRKSFFKVSSGTQLQLRDSSCKPQETKYYYVFTTSLIGCRTTMATDRRGNGTVVFTNKVLERRSSFGSSITRSKDIQFTFSCRYPRSYLVSSLPGFGLADVATTVGSVIGASKKMSLVMNFYEDLSFKKTLIKPPLNKRMYVEIRIKNTTSPKTQSPLGIKLNECYATSFDAKPVYRYILIERGCQKDKTVKFHHSPGNTARFSFVTFRFRGLRHYTTRVHCRVTICDRNSKTCQQKCRSPSNGKRMLLVGNDEEMRLI